jgi:hypothetical protein
MESEVPPVMEEIASSWLVAEVPDDLCVATNHSALYPATLYPATFYPATFYPATFYVSTFYAATFHTATFHTTTLLVT